MLPFCAVWLARAAAAALVLTSGTVLVSGTEPALIQVMPAAGVVTELTSVTVTFNEPVEGVDAEDFLVNNQPATEVSGTGTTYRFVFPQPEYGVVDIRWEAGHGITSLGEPPQSFDDSGAAWSYKLTDTIAPTVASIVPPPDATLRSLSDVEVRFSEEVTGVDAGDLLLNGVPALSVEMRYRRIFTFHFPEPPPGPITLSWAQDGGISDLAESANLFTGSTWSYRLDPALKPARVEITELLAGAENPAGLKDEDGELQDWIELQNTGQTAANLENWSLTDDPEDPDLWLFPKIILEPGERLVVFASGKNRRSPEPGAKLHTSFKLSSSGEYLALFNAESPRAASTEFQGRYPDQRNDYSYGWDGTEWRYYQKPTPGAANGASTIVGVVPKPDVSVKRGFFDAPFTLALTNKLEGTTIRYTLDGTLPTASSGQLYSAPLTINRSTILRAAAFRANYLPSEAITHTYLYLDQVLHQPNNPPGFPVGPKVMAGYPSDYEMDPEIVNDPAYENEMKAALQALPSISIVMKTDDMFGAANGIYTHPLSRGLQWERPCSLEFIPFDGKSFQLDAGIQVQGNAAREPIKQPKHPLRVVFKGDYGPSRLEEKFFPDSPVSSFDTLVLRADFNYSWLHWNPTQRIRAQRTRDAWMKDTMRDMGDLASHNRYLHLYINGLYWGVYDASERPDASFAAAYLGGDKEDYDVVNEGEVVDGSISEYNAMLSFPEATTVDQYDEIKRYLDIPQFIDYMLLHFFVGHEDWGNNKNWYTMRPKDGSRGFIYVPWDGEMVLGDANANRVSNTDVPSGLHTKLLASDQYRLDFADRVQRHLFNHGALTPESNTARWRSRANEVELPIIAESARWGDYRRDVHQYQSPPYQLYTRDNQWRTEQNRLLNSYFPGRTATVLKQLQTAGLYPSVAAPSFSQFGGKIEPGFQLQISAPTGRIYYTTNGVDPRVYGSGQISPSAFPYSAPVPLAGTTHLKARVLAGSTWSALTEANFSIASFRIPLRVTELMYNPDPPGEAYEYIELQNFSPLPFDASGFSLGGVDYLFPPVSVLQPGEIIVLASSADPSSFASRYPGVPVYGRFGGQLANHGERISLVSPKGQKHYSIDYSDGSGWPKTPDGHGASLEINDPFGDPDNPSNWHGSAALNGSPGKPNSSLSLPTARINEILAAPESGSDWVELANTTAIPIDLGGWTLREVGNSDRLIFPPRVALAPGSYVIVYCDKLTNKPGLHAPFALDSQSETLILENADGTVVDVVQTGPQAKGYSTGLIDSRFVLCHPTPGDSNTPATLGSPTAVRINEWLASSGAGEPDWLEVYNSDSANPVSLQGLFLGVTELPFEINTLAFIAPGGHVKLLADEQPGPNHLDFKLPAEGAAISVYGQGEELIDSIQYTAQTPGISEGIFPEGTHNVVTFPLTPTPGKPNSLSVPIASALEADQFVVRWSSLPGTSYRVERSDDLATWSEWVKITATESVTSARDSLGGTHHYYRLVALPAQ